MIKMDKIQQNHYFLTNMKLLSTPNQFQSEFKRLISKYTKYYWAVAWASKDFRAFDNLEKNKDRIKQLVVGIHFYQTHPTFIETFLTHPNVSFIMEPEGVFHPKIYLFEIDESNWECIIGSNNFTKSAFEKNTEFAVLFDSKCSGSESLYNSVHESINSFWDKSKKLNEKEFEKYKDIWKRKQPLIKNVSGHKQQKSKSRFEIEILNLSWDEYYKVIKEDQYDSLNKRIKVINKSKSLFNDYPHFKDIPLEYRKHIAGFLGEYEGESKWFGSMQGCGIFMKKIIQNNSFISDALNQIPISGTVSKDHYDEYVKLYKKAFGSNKNYVGTATRLLCMKRPDFFLCLNSKNKKKLCKEFGRPQKIDFDEYWDEIIERITDSCWWNSKEPTHANEKDIWNSRVAFLDSYFYEK